jgi:hypothetical protein
MSTAPICGAQQPSPVPGSFDWWVLGAPAIVASAGGAGYALGNLLFGSAVFGASTFTGGVAGAAAIFVLVLYYALQPDGCIRSTTKGEPICLSGIVQDTVDTSSSAAVAILAPFAMGPAGLFDLVVKTVYWHYVTQNAFWVFCDDKGASMLPCIIKSKTACGAKIGSLIGVTVGAIAGAFAGYFAAAAVGIAIGCGASGPFYLFCLIICLIIAAIVAAAVAIVGAMIGGWIGQGIASAGSDPVGDSWKGLDPGAIVTVKGNWVTEPTVGNNQLFYTTDISRTGQFATQPSYTTADADSTPADDCPINPPPPPK